MEFYYYYIIFICIFLVLINYYNIQMKKKRNYFFRKKMTKKEVLIMKEKLIENIGKTVLIETISAKPYGEILEVNDEVVVLNSNSKTLEVEVVKLEYIISFQVYKNKTKNK